MAKSAKLEVCNADGSLMFSTAHRLFRTLLSVDTGTSNGSATIPTGQGAVLVAANAKGDNRQTPAITVSGSTVSWSFGSTPMGQRGDTTLDVLAY